jgi:hypothetical protein
MYLGKPRPLLDLQTARPVITQLPFRRSTRACRFGYRTRRGGETRGRFRCVPWGLGRANGRCRRTDPRRAHRETVWGLLWVDSFKGVKSLEVPTVPPRGPTPEEPIISSSLRRTLCEILLPAMFGFLIGREERLDPQFLHRDVLRPAEGHDGTEQA